MTRSAVGRLLCAIGLHRDGAVFARMMASDGYENARRCHRCGRSKQVPFSDVEIDEWGRPLRWPPLPPPDNQKH